MASSMIRQRKKKQVCSCKRTFSPKNLNIFHTFICLDKYYLQPNILVGVYCVMKLRHFLPENALIFNVNLVCTVARTVNFLGKKWKFLQFPH